jgi:hypothetical protein
MFHLVKTGHGVFPGLEHFGGTVYAVLGILNGTSRALLRCMAYKPETLDLHMLQNIDGTPAYGLEFEEKCRLRTLARYGVRVIKDDAGVMHVDWSTVSK